MPKYYNLLFVLLGYVSYPEVAQTGRLGYLRCSGDRSATGHRGHTAHNITTDPSIRYANNSAHDSLKVI